MINKIDIAWLAGIIDGEGCIYPHVTNKRQGNHNLCFRVEAQATSIRMIDEIERIYTAMEIRFIRSGPRMQPLSTRPAYKIIVQRGDAVLLLLSTIASFLRVKDLEANAVIGFLNDRINLNVVHSIASRYELVDRVRLLKKLA